MSHVTRRHVLQITAAATLSNVTTAAATLAEPERPQSGSDVTPELYTGRAIELYTSTLSASAGETVSLHVSTVAKRFHLQIARVGAPDKVVWTKNDLPGRLYPTPDDAWEKGCAWPASVSLEIPRDWRSGFCLISAVTADEAAPHTTAFAFVVVRATKPTAKILLVHPTATYGAYNSYGGASLYVKRGNDSKGGLIGGERRVSFLRPWMPGFLWKPENYSFDAELADVTDEERFAKRYDAHGISKTSGIATYANVAGFHNWDRVLIHWLEKNGYDFDCAISSDLDLHPELLGRYRLMLSVGHDEYWSWGMRDTVESFVAKGGNACFFSANIIWQVRYEDSGNTMVCYKEAAEEDPLFKTDKKHLTATLWSSSIVNRPETSLTGLSYWYGGYSGWDGASLRGPGGYLVYRPDHWVFKDSGMTFGDCLGGASKVVHFEVDGCPIQIEQGLPYPAKDYEGPSSLEILGLCPTGYSAPDQGNVQAAKRLLGESKVGQAAVRGHGHAVMGIFTNPGTVFCAGTTDWANGLTGKDPAVEKVTRNLLDRLQV